MKKFVIILILSFSSIYAQDKKPKNLPLIKSIVENFNSSNYDQIYSMFNDRLKNEVESDIVLKFFSDVKGFHGTIKNFEFVKYDKGMNGEISIGLLNFIKISKSNFPVERYKVSFEREALQLDLVVDNDQKIDDISLDPYIDNAVSEKAINSLKLNNELIDEKQQKVIFNKSKYLPNNTQISIGLIKNGQVNYYGIKRQNDSIFTVNNSKNIFEIGSISKVLTANILSKFVLENKISLNDNINNYFDLTLKDSVQIKFKSLANHTSGIPRMPNNFSNSSKKNPLNPYKEYKVDDLETYLLDSLKINQDTKGKFLYSNLGFALIGYTLSKIDNQDYKSMFDSYIFSKYEMTNSTFKKEEVNDLLVKGLNSQGDEVPNWDLQIFGPAGGVLSNAEDMAKFIIAQFDERDKELKLLRAQTSKINSRLGMGLGWFIENPKSNKKRMYRHGGNTGGYSSMIIVDVKNKNGIIILSNVTSRNPYFENINKLAASLIKNIRD